MKKNKSDAASKAVTEINRVMDSRQVVRWSDGYIAIQHNSGLEPYEIPEKDIISHFDLIDKLKELEKKNWMTVEMAVNLVEVHFHMNHK